jgi:signal transduction histidine kinase
MSGFRGDRRAAFATAVGVLRRVTGDSGSYSAADKADHSDTQVQALEHELRERERELARLRIQWEAWLSLLSHDARTPLTVILGYAENLLAQLPKSDADDSPNRQLQAIAVGARRLNLMISQIVDGARLDAGGVAVEPRPVDLVGTIKTELRRVRLAYPEHHFRPDFLGSLPQVIADTRYVAQVIGSFLSNAASYSPPGSEIGVSARRRGDQVIVSVSDPGHGLTSDELSRVFERGFHSARPPEARPEGLGLSLVIAKRSAELLGGEVWASSPGPGRGATFNLALPVVKGHSAPEDSTATSRPS